MNTSVLVIYFVLSIITMFTIHDDFNFDTVFEAKVSIDDKGLMISNQAPYSPLIKLPHSQAWDPTKIAPPIIVKSM